MPAEELQRAIREMQRQSIGGNIEEALYVSHDHNNSYGSNNSYSNNNTNEGKGKGGGHTGGRGRGCSSFNSRRSSSCNFCGNQGHWEPECLKKIESQIKDLQTKHSDVRKGKHHINVAEADVVKPKTMSLLMGIWSPIALR
ncbi:unnamed protein product [Calypogeia fissa]